MATDVKHRVAVNPVVGRKTAYLLAHFRQIFRGDAKLVSIVTNIAVLTEVFTFQQSQDAYCEVIFSFPYSDAWKSKKSIIMHWIALIMASRWKL